jgi:transposase
MNPITRIKNIGGKEYFYEVTPYYDPKSKRIRHKSKYLGKNIKGKPVRLRSKIPQHSYAYGEYIPLFAITQELKIEEILTWYLPQEQNHALLTIAYNRVLRPLALCHIRSWYEGTMLSKNYGDLPLSSQSLSKLLERIGRSDLPMEFSKQLIRNLCPSKALIYDITSLSSYSHQISMFEYGYNRDGLDLPQVNLSIIVDKNRGIPIMYELYPGSIVDVTTLHNMVKKVVSFRMEQFLLILDRGFFSTPNINDLLQHKISFLIPVPLTVKKAKHLLSTVHRDISNPRYMHMYHDDVLFVLSKTVHVGDHHLSAYVYYSPKRESDERDVFYKRLYTAVERLKNVQLREWMNPQEILEEIAGNLEQYLQWRVKNQRFQVNIKSKAVAQRINRMGKFILLYKQDLSWEECLTFYQEKDIIEKGFHILKNDIETLPTNVHKNDTLKGFLFICFLSMIIRMRLLKLMQTTHLAERYTLDSLFLELEKIKKISLTNGEMITTELTKKQKDILAKLSLCA